MGLGVELDLGFLKPLLHPQCSPLAEWTVVHFHLLPLEIQFAKDMQGTPAPRNTILSDHPPSPPWPCCPLCSPKPWTGVRNGLLAMNTNLNYTTFLGLLSSQAHSCRSEVTNLLPIAKA